MVGLTAVDTKQSAMAASAAVVDTKSKAAVDPAKSAKDGKKEDAMLSIKVYVKEVTKESFTVLPARITDTASKLCETIAKRRGVQKYV